MNVPIRFRGKRVDTGEYVFGFYQKNSVGDTFITDEHFIMNCVDPDSVAQLCGYDADDDEVYEGDTLVNSNGDEWTAEIIHALVTDDGFRHILPTELFTLKVAES